MKMSKYTSLIALVTLGSLLALLCVVNDTHAKAPQFPLSPQFPQERETKDTCCLCECCQNGGVCTCTPANDRCGCWSDGSKLYHWVETSDSNQVALYRGNTQIGNWRLTERTYRQLLNVNGGICSWQENATCPVVAPKNVQPVRTAPTIPRVSFAPVQTFAPSYGMGGGFVGGGFSGGFSGGACRGGS